MTVGNTAPERPLTPRRGARLVALVSARSRNGICPPALAKCRAGRRCSGVAPCSRRRCRSNLAASASMSPTPPRRPTSPYGGAREQPIGHLVSPGKLERCPPSFFSGLFFDRFWYSRVPSHVESPVPGVRRRTAVPKSIGNEGRETGNSHGLL